MFAPVSFPSNGRLILRFSSPVAFAFVKSISFTFEALSICIDANGKFPSTVNFAVPLTLFFSKAI